MSLRIETVIVCDRCGRTFGEDKKHLTGTDLRELAWKEGWIRGNYADAKRDVCGPCRNMKPRKRKSKGLHMLTDVEVHEIRNSKFTLKTLAVKYHISESSVFRIRHGFERGDVPWEKENPTMEIAGVNHY